MRGNADTARAWRPPPRLQCHPWLPRGSPWNLAGSIEKLDAPLVPWQTGSPATDRLLLQLGGHKFTLTLRFVGQRWRIRGEQVARQVSVLGDSGEDLMRGKPEIIGPAYAT